MLRSQFAELCRDWMKRLPAADARAALAALLATVIRDPSEAGIDEMIALALGAEPELAPAPDRRQTKPKRERAQALVHAQLAAWPKPGAEI